MKVKYKESSLTLSDVKERMNEWKSRSTVSIKNPVWAVFCIFAVMLSLIVMKLVQISYAAFIGYGKDWHSIYSENPDSQLLQIVRAMLLSIGLPENQWENSKIAAFIVETTAGISVIFLFSMGCLAIMLLLYYALKLLKSKKLIICNPFWNRRSEVVRIYENVEKCREFINSVINTDGDVSYKFIVHKNNLQVTYMKNGIEQTKSFYIGRKVRYIIDDTGFLDFSKLDEALCLLDYNEAVAEEPKQLFEMIKTACTVAVLLPCSLMIINMLTVIVLRAVLYLS